MRKPLPVVALIAFLLALIELTSSYVLYRHFAKTHRPFQPKGLAVSDLVMRAFSDHSVKVKSDAGHVFESDPVLGYVMRPGSYRITERSYDSMREFLLTVDASGHRADSYFKVSRAKRIILAGDSGTFGWGVDDEWTITWLLQSRLPDYEVVNLSMTSYSTVQAVLQLERLEPAISEKDIVILVYHPITSDFNVWSQLVLKPLLQGYETQLGSPDVAQANLPFGTIDANGQLKIERVSVSCAKPTPPVTCDHPEVSQDYKYRVTELVIDRILDTQKAKILLAVMNAGPEDPVVPHARERGMHIVDFRERMDEGSRDFSAMDGHPGPYWHHMAYELILGALQSNHLLD